MQWQSYLDVPYPKVTRKNVLNEYKNLTGYVKQSEEIVHASVTEHLMKAYKHQDISILRR